MRDGKNGNAENGGNPETQLMIAREQVQVKQSLYAAPERDDGETDYNGKNKPVVPATFWHMNTLHV